MDARFAFSGKGFKMRSTELTEIGVPWSVITFGCWQIAPSEGWGNVCSASEAEFAVKTALDCGVTAFDTAEGYGDGESERRLGLALGKKKYDVVVISKIWPDADLTVKCYQERLENSLRAIDRDYVDVYLVHWPGEFFDSPSKSEKLCELMFRLKVSGKAKTVGLSNFKAPDLKLLGERVSHFVVNQVPYNLLDRRYEDATLDICREAEIPYMAYSPTAQGLLGGRFDKIAMGFPVRQRNPLFQSRLFPEAKKLYDLVCNVAEELNRKPVEVAVAWVIAQSNFFTAIVGSHKTKQIKEFAGAGDLELTGEYMSRLTAASDAFHKFRNSLL